MGVDWDYAKLSKSASKVGGPEKLVEIIEQSGYQKGIRTMAPIAISLTIVGALIGKYSPEIKEKIKRIKDKHISKAEKEKAKQELIDAINKYNENNSTYSNNTDTD